MWARYWGSLVTGASNRHIAGAHCKALQRGTLPAIGTVSGKTRFVAQQSRTFLSCKVFSGARMILARISGQNSWAHQTAWEKVAHPRNGSLIWPFGREFYYFDLDHILRLSISLPLCILSIGPSICISIYCMAYRIAIRLAFWPRSPGTALCALSAFPAIALYCFGIAVYGNLVHRRSETILVLYSISLFFS